MLRVRTIQTLINARVPSDRAQLSSRIARLEHERARLERERSMWALKEMQIDERLRAILGQLASMQSMMNPPQEPANQSTPSLAQPAEQRRTVSGKTYKTVPLEY
jgi:FtsZ-binding cell division protein ZapB